MIDGPDTAWITLALGWMQLKDFESAWSKLKVTMMNIQRPFQVGRRLGLISLVGT
jgi:hypothetical protein